MQYPSPHPQVASHVPSRGLRTFVLFVLLLVTFAAAAPAHAATRVVTTFADVINPNDGFLSLREAIADSPAGDVITFAPNIVGTMGLSRGELVIGRALTIIGPGARKLALSGNNVSRIFNISGTGIVDIRGLTVTRGWAHPDLGSSSYYGSAQGGAVYNTAPLIMRECVISNSSARGASGTQKYGGAGSGGGIWNRGSLTLLNCLVCNNSVYSGTGLNGLNALAYGGGIHSFSRFSLTNTTIANNVAQYNGGGMMVGYSDQSNLTACTITGNQITSGSQNDASCGINSHYSTTTKLRNCIVAGNRYGSQNRDLNGTFASLGYNLIGATDGTDSFPAPIWQATDLTGTRAAPLNAQLGPLKNNGGATDTVAPFSGSAAINTGDNNLPVAPLNVTTDQRGLPRRIGTSVDIGAYETDLPQAGPNYVVNSLDDPGDGIPGQNQCTLREALTAMNVSGDANVVSFKAGLTGTIVLLPSAGPLPISTPVTISGPGARTMAVSGGSAVRVFDVVSAGVTFIGITIRDGAVTGVTSQTGGNAMGGGIRNTGTLSLVSCTLMGNRAWGGAGSGNGATATGGTGYGGAIYNAGTLSVRNSTFTGNDARGGDAFNGLPEISGSGLGGAIYNYGSATLTNCTLSRNTAAAGFYGFGGLGNGAGLYNAGSSLRFGTRSIATLISCTIANNYASGVSGATGGGLFTAAQANSKQINWSYIRLRNTLVGQNVAATSSDTAGSYISDGNNLVGKRDGSTGWVATDRGGTNAVPLLVRVATAVANNGGQTDTLALLAGSPAINTAAASGTVALDQRNFRRSGLPDIGAFEFGGVP